MTTRASGFSRRQCLQGMMAAGALAPALLSLAGCRGGNQVCPDNRNESGGIDWVPDVMHPVFWGFQTLDVAHGAPGPLQIYYPSVEGSPQNAPILKLCLIRYPVVLFMHGAQPGECSNDQEYYKRWHLLGRMLARSGYVVVMPKHGANAFEESSPDVVIGLAALDFVRTGWEHRNWVDADARSTAVAGHSYGAMIAARIRKARPTIRALVGLSGVWVQAQDAIALLQSIRGPSFLTWTPDFNEELDYHEYWNEVPGPKWAATFAGQHFDYLAPYSGCDLQRGSCDLIQPVMNELVALFLSRHVPVKFSQTEIPWNLKPPTVTLTEKQAFFAGQNLNGLQQIESRRECSIRLRWRFGLIHGSRHLAFHLLST